MRVMSLKALLALGVIALTPGLAHAGTANGHYSVELNKTEVVYLPASAGAVVIGNPEIADVSIHSANTIFVVGRGFDCRPSRRACCCLFLPKEEARIDCFGFDNTSGHSQDTLYEAFFRRPGCSCFYFGCLSSFGFQLRLHDLAW